MSPYESPIARAARDILERLGEIAPAADMDTRTGTGGGLVHGAALVHTAGPFEPGRHSVHVDSWPSDGPDVAPAECAHGYSSGCPDCDVPSYLPAVLDLPAGPPYEPAEIARYFRPDLAEPYPVGTAVLARDEPGTIAELNRDLPGPPRYLVRMASSFYRDVPQLFERDELAPAPHE